MNLFGNISGRDRTLPRHWRIIVSICVAVVLGATFMGLATNSSRSHCRPSSHRCNHRGTNSSPVGCSGPSLRCDRNSIYVAEHARGKGQGRSCGNARGVAWFNHPANWQRGVGHIRPGVIVRLCGQISSRLVAYGSGRKGAPITVYWEPGATLSSPDWGGHAAFETNGHRFLTLDGGVDGSIQATADGSGLADQGVASMGVMAIGCSGCTVEHLTIENLYRHTLASDTSVDQTLDNAIRFSGSNVTIADNRIHDVGWALVADWANGDRNASIHGNNIYNTDHAFTSSSSFPRGRIGPIAFYGNHLHDYANWDTPTDAYHHDGIHCFTSDNGAGPSHYAGFYIYDNVFGGNTGGNITAQIFVEGGAEGTPCADATSQIWVFNNVASVSRDVYNGIFGLFSGSPHVLNNTMIGPDNVGGGVAFASTNPIANEDFRNNVVTTANELMVVGAQVAFISGAPNHNVYANGGNNAFVCGRNFYSFGQFGSWRGCVRGDQHSLRVRSVRLDARGAPQLGSAALHAGLNLTPMCTGHLAALCRNILGRPRAAHGRWNAGAY